MYIDSHVHAFTEKIAARAIAKLSDTASSYDDGMPYTDGTINGARRLLSECGVDYGILLPIATKPTQQRTINEWAIKHNHGSLVSCGTVHPYADNVAEELEFIKKSGLKGVKLHHDYQGVFAFDEKCSAVYEGCAELGLPVVMHIGFDPVSPHVHHATAHDVMEIRRRFPKLKIVSAHFGGMYEFEAFLHYFAGTDIYIDTAFIDGNIGFEVFEAIVKKHTPDRILFGSDLPWHRPDGEIKMIDALKITSEEKDRIFYKNAAELFGIEV